MTSRVQWRRFLFFDKDTVNDNIEAALGCPPTCAAAEGGILLFGDGNGNISMADRNFNVTWTHKAFSGPVRGVAYVYDLLNHRKQYVIAAGEEAVRSSVESKSQASESYVIKVFMTGDMSRPIQAFHAGSSLLPEGCVMTDFAVTSNGFQIAVGYSSGAVVLFSGNFLLDGSLGRQYVPQILLQNHKYSVSGLYFCELNHSAAKSTNDRYVRLFVVMGGESTAGKGQGEEVTDSTGAGSDPSLDSEVSEAGIIVFDTSYSTFGGTGGGSLTRTPPRVLDYTGASSQCSSLMRQTSELVVGREEGVFSYSIEDRGGAAGFEGEKQCVTAVGRYILVGCMDEKTKRTMITIYDLRNKFISMSHLLPLGDSVRMVLHDGGIAYVVTSSWSLIRFTEKDTSSKLDVLLRRSLYPLAISLAAEEQSDVSEVMRLYKMYADHLYKKNDFEGAVTQYCHTIGFVQPSYVIRRFLDTQRICNLTMYLEKLHSRGIATKDHTTLLLTCYTKTNNEQKLTEFCQMSSNNNESSLSVSPAKTGANGSATTDSATPTVPFNFDVLTAVYTLHEAGFDSHALALALGHGKHEEYISINLVSKTEKDVDRALSYLVALIAAAELPMDDIMYLVMKFGPSFLAERPKAFTGLLIQLCTGTVDRGHLRALLIEEAGERIGEVTEGLGESVTKGKPQFLQETLSVEHALGVFSDDEKSLRVFLEGVSAGDTGQTMPPKVTELLVELYLSEYQSLRCTLLDLTSSPENGGQPSASAAMIDTSSKLKSLEDRITAILDGASSANSDFDASSVLLMMHAFGYEGGEMFLLDKMMSTDLILRKYIETGNERGIMRVLRREGKKDPELFVQVLGYFVRLSMQTSGAENVDDDSEEEDERWDLISEVLTLVEREQVLTPMQIIPILSENPNLPLRIAARFIRRSMQETSEELEKLEEDVAHMKHIVQGVVQEGVAARQHKLNQQDSNGKGKQTRGGGLRDYDDFEDDDDELEAQQAEAERELERRKWQNIKKAQIERTGDHESFFAELEHSNDGFATVAAYYGKTVIS
mmetsp:Transcript_11655/g.17666  ORF Transcript_11655/g.17666 Transcript_11655/m.17666 type:complete len:1045 (+) Transcript_11655:67-3201(+)